MSTDDQLKARIDALKEFKRRNPNQTGGRSALLPIENEIASLVKISSCTTSLSNYRMTGLTNIVQGGVRELNSFGRGLLSGVLKDMGTIHESGRVHGDVTMNSIRVWDFGGDNCLGALPDIGPLICLEEGPELSNGISRDFLALADVIDGMFRLRAAGEDKPDEVVHLLNLLRNETHDRQRGLIYFHPCAMKLSRKWAIVSGISAMIHKDSITERDVHKAIRQIPSAILLKWTKATKSGSLGNQAIVTKDKVIGKITDTVETAYPSLFFLQYVQDVMGHHPNISLDYKLKHLYSLFPTLVCHLLELTLHIKKIKLEVYEDYFYDLVCEDRQRPYIDKL